MTAIGIIGIIISLVMFIEVFVTKKEDIKLIFWGTLLISNILCAIIYTLINLI